MHCRALISFQTPLYKLCVNTEEQGARGKGAQYTVIFALAVLIHPINLQPLIFIIVNNDELSSVTSSWKVFITVQ